MDKVGIVFLVVVVALVLWQMIPGRRPSVQTAAVCGTQLLQCTKELAQDSVAQKNSMDLCASACGLRRAAPDCFTKCMEERTQQMLQPCKEKFFACAIQNQPSVDSQQLEQLWAQHMERKYR